jgi:YidC/Oxa1 family membrane protein insertase
MDRNTIIGFLLVLGIIIGFSYLNRPSKEEVETAKRRSDSLALVRAEQEQMLRAAEEIAKQKMAERDSLAIIDQKLRLGSFAEASLGERTFITLENNLMKINVSTLGGNIYSVELKNYFTYSQEPLVLFADDKNVFGLQFWGFNNNIETHKLFFTPDTPEQLITVTEATGSKTLTMRLLAGELSYIDYEYTIYPESYMIDYSIRFTNMDNVISGRPGSIDLVWDFLLPQLEKGIENECNYTSISYRLPNGDFEELNPRSDKTNSEVKTRIQWIGYKQQFFSTFLVSDEHFLNADFSSTKIADGGYTKQFTSRISIPFDSGKDEVQNFKMYFGPNHFNTLKQYEYGFEDVVPLGSWIIKWINRYVIIFLFDFLDNYIGSYGLIILLLTIIIKVVLFPLTFKSYISQAKMRVLKPQVDEINAKFPKKEDAMKKQQSVMALYKKVGVSPLGGCLPMLIQFPFLIAMFRFFPASFELRQKSFLWADDLSTYDSIIDLPFSIPMYGDHISLFTLLMALAMFITSKTSTSQMGDTNAQMPGMKFMMLYMMPLMLLVWFNNYSAGLSYYYFLSNVITLGQTYLIRQTVDDQEILSKLNANSKKPVTKSKFQAKLEEMAKQQKQIQKKKK